MAKLSNKAPATKRTKNSAPTGNGARNGATDRSVAGKKLYAVRDAQGRFVDIQTYERAHIATANEIYRALRVKPETVKRVQQIIRDLEAKTGK